MFADVANASALDLTDELGGLERRLLLTQLVTKWAASQAIRREGSAPLVANNPASALALADALARLMDDMTTRQVPWDKLDTLVPGEHDEYWQLTLRFLNEIVRNAWPAILAERGRIEPAERRDLLIAAEAKRLAAHTSGPVIAAGSTGSMPATATLIETISKLPHGAVVLPGLDTDLDEAAWDDIAGQRDADGRTIVAPAIGHPQFAMQALLRRIGITRDEVRRLGEPAAHGREAVVSEVMRPADTTDQWRELAQRGLRLDDALAHVAVIAAANAEEEALAIAVALREVLETDGKTAALVTPDRALARRVLAALARWNVAVDDSGGDALADTPAGVFARLIVEAAFKGLEPVTLLALLKHPLLRLGAGAGAHAQSISVIEQAVLRGPRPKPGTAGLAHALDHVPRQHREALPRRPAHAADAGAIAERRRPDRGAHRSAQAARSAGQDTPAARDACRRAPPGHRRAVANAQRRRRRLRRPRRQRARPRVRGDRRQCAGRRRGRGVGLSRPVPRHRRRAAGAPARPAGRARPHLRPARSAAAIDRPRRARRAGRGRMAAGDAQRSLAQPSDAPQPRSRPAGAAHFAFGARLRADARRRARSCWPIRPSLPARRRSRRASCSGWRRSRASNDGTPRANAASATSPGRASSIGPTAVPRPVPRPEPKPARDARPTALSVTEIETWLRDPYSIYARHILKLQPLDAIDTPPGARDRGTVIHGAIGRFTSQFKDALPNDAIGELIKLGEEEFAVLEDFPEARAFWWPRFLRIARWFADFETRRRLNVTGISAEIGAKLEIPLGHRAFTLRTRADRIEHLRDGSYAILDYKTGRPPTTPQVSTGLTPQLTLEGAILRAGKFEGIPAGASIAEVLYVSLRGGDPAGELKPIAFDDSTPDEKSDEALRKLTVLVTKFEDEEIGYLSKERPMFMRRGGGDYDHLARVKEWSLTSGAAEDGGEAE